MKRACCSVLRLVCSVRGLGCLHMDGYTWVVTPQSETVCTVEDALAHRMTEERLRDVRCDKTDADVRLCVYMCGCVVVAWIVITVVLCGMCVYMCGCVVVAWLFVWWMLLLWMLLLFVCLLLWMLLFANQP